MTVVCPNCSAGSADGAAFCATCGTSLAHSCPNCGADAAPGAAFCATCGTALDEHAVEATRPAEERRVVSVLFADLAGFTERTERSDPEDVRARLTVYHKTAREQVEAHGGRVEKLMGDGIFAIFGVPAAHEDDPERAVRAALRLQEAIEVLNEDNPDLALSVRIAVTTGEAIVQLEGDDQDRESIIGDVVNTASRLEAVAPPGGIVVDERTYMASRSIIAYDDLDSVDLKGKADATAIWLATGRRARQGVAVEERHKGPFVGRDPERAVLVDSLDRAIGAETIQLVTIIGEPGAGKSRLLHEFKAVLDLRSDDMWWKQGRCLPYGEGITFWALGEIVKAQAGILESDTEADADRKLHHAVSTLVNDPTQAEWMVSRLSLLAGGSAWAASRSSRASCSPPGCSSSRQWPTVTRSSWWWRTSIGQTRPCSTSSNISPSGPSTCRSFSSRPLAPSCSPIAPDGVAVSATQRQSASAHLPMMMRRRCSPPCSIAPSCRPRPSR